MTPEERWQHIMDMTFRKGYAAAYYGTIMHNENMKAAGKPMIPFDPKEPMRHLDAAWKNDSVQSAEPPREASR